MKSRTVLITGASGGIGSAAARAFAQRGYNLILQYNNTEISELEKDLKAKGIAVSSFKADLRKQKDIEALASFSADCYCGIDVLVNCAGIALYGLFEDTGREEWENIFSINVTGPAMLTRELIPSMLNKKSGCIINISSIWGETGASMEVAYSASKAALTGFTKALAKELAPSGIRVNAVCPGPTDTAMMHSFSYEEIECIKKDIPLGRMATPKEIAEAVVFLSESDYITGYILNINGGALM